jgi:hypothetical protein
MDGQDPYTRCRVLADRYGCYLMANDQIATAFRCLSPMTAMAMVVAIVTMAVIVTIVPTRPVVSICVTGVAAVIVVTVDGAIISICAIGITVIMTMMVAVDPAQYQGRRYSSSNSPSPSTCACARFAPDVIIKAKATASLIVRSERLCGFCPRKAEISASQGVVPVQTQDCIAEHW